MAEQNFQNEMSSSDYIVEKVELNSTRFLEPVELTSVISAIEIFEHIDKPLLSGNVAIHDTSRIYDRSDFQGAENLLVSIKRSLNGPAYQKMFVIDTVTTRKINPTSEVITFHITEETGFKSNLYNVNKSYRGKPSSIVQRIADEYLKKAVNVIGDNDYQGDMNVIVPNMTPLEAMVWIKNRATNTEGYPYFLYSTFAEDFYSLANLSDLLSAQSMNKKNPYFFGHGAGLSPTEQRFMVINDYRHQNAENMTRLIRNGLIGANHHYYDSLHAFDQKVRFNIQDDLRDTIAEKNSDQSQMNVADDYMFDDVPLAGHVSREIYKVSSSGAYTIGTGNYNSYDEEEYEGGHRKKLQASALKHLLAKSAIEIKVDGREYMAARDQDPVHYTIGNSIRLIFLANISANQLVQKVDPKKSGDYIIFTAKHTFVGERYDLTLLCAKVANLNSDEYVTTVSAESQADNSSLPEEIIL